MPRGVAAPGGVPGLGHDTDGRTVERIDREEPASGRHGIGRVPDRHVRRRKIVQRLAVVRVLPQAEGVGLDARGEEPGVDQALAQGEQRVGLEVSRAGKVAVQRAQRLGRAPAL